MKEEGGEERRLWCVPQRRGEGAFRCSQCWEGSHVRTLGWVKLPLGLSSSVRTEPIAMAQPALERVLVSAGCSALLEEPAWRTQNCSDEHTACVLGNRSMLLFCKEENVLMLHCSDILQTLQVFLIFEHILQQEEEQFSMKMRFRKW